MLSFLRKIRKSLIGSGSAGRYFLYAIGEILLVVVGILIALQINNWNNRWLERQEELRILVDLEEELNLAIDSRVQLRQHYSSQIDTLAFALDKLFSTEVLDLSDSECIAIAMTHIFNWDPYSVSTIEELVASGKINLIKSKILRRGIVQFRNTTMSIEQKMDRVLSEVNVLVDRYPLQIIRTWDQQTQWYAYRCDILGMKSSPHFLAHLQSNRGRMMELVKAAEAEIALLEDIKERIVLP